MKKLHPLIVASICLLLIGCKSNALKAETSTILAYCDVVANPSQYDGQVVSISANYTFGFEHSFLADEKCSSDLLDDNLQTWIVIYHSTPPCENASEVDKSLAPTSGGKVSAIREVVVKGTFHNSRITFAEREYSFYMDFICLEKAGGWQVVQTP